MILFGVDMFERWVKLYNSAVDSIMPKSTPDIVYRAFQLLQLRAILLALSYPRAYSARVLAAWVVQTSKTKAWPVTSMGSDSFTETPA